MKTEPHKQVSSAGSVDDAILTRFSCRQFDADAPVSRNDIEDILMVARRAPSGSNIRPWNVYIVQGASQRELSEKVCAAHDAVYRDPAESAKYVEAYDYYPAVWTSPFIDRRRKNGWALYQLLGIERGEKDKMHAQQQRNFRFFDAPVGMFFTVDRSLGRGALFDYGAFVQSIMLAARARGLHTCPQAAWNPYASIVLPHLGAGDSGMLVCALCIGYASESALVNTLRTPRDELASFTHWVE
jgi:nitroreductase